MKDNKTLLNEASKYAKANLPQHESDIALGYRILDVSSTDGKISMYAIQKYAMMPLGATDGEKLESIRKNYYEWKDVNRCTSLEVAKRMVTSLRTDYNRKCKCEVLDY